MEGKKVEVLETNKYVQKHKGEIFKKTYINYDTLLDKKTRQEHERQLERIRSL